MAFINGGHRNFIQNHTKIIIAIDCKTNVALIFMPYLAQMVRLPRPPQRTGPRQPESAANGILELADKRIREGEEQRDTNADHRHGVKQADCQEELALQHRGEFRLTGGTFQQATAQDTDSDTNAEGAQADQKANGDCGHTNYSFHR
jgi:hypothetical protein